MLRVKTLVYLLLVAIRSPLSEESDEMLEGRSTDHKSSALISINLSNTCFSKAKLQVIVVTLWKRGYMGVRRGKIRRILRRPDFFIFYKMYLGPCYVWSP